ncbi:hypothetical protein NPIL_612931 [Nephila pilipes]|uniref:Uncharacterized protein n=1 Tax=Nephila pilipes TaxID=299642 RepID=A0A8X6T8C4_NEPPI|nr:hypothetical protein NPIL_612931 [Nephila pilipes]
MPRDYQGGFNSTSSSIAYYQTPNLITVNMLLRNTAWDTSSFMNKDKFSCNRDRVSSAWNDGLVCDVIPISLIHSTQYFNGPRNIETPMETSAAVVKG